MTPPEKPRRSPGQTCPLWRKDVSKVCHTCDLWRAIESELDGVAQTEWCCSFVAAVKINTLVWARVEGTQKAIETLRNNVIMQNSQLIKSAKKAIESRGGNEPED